MSHELGNGIRDIIHWDKVERRSWVAWNAAQHPLGNKAQRPIDRREVAGIAVARITHDDARPEDRDGQMCPCRPGHELGLELRLLVGIKETLAALQLPLEDETLSITGDESRAYPREQFQPGAGLRQPKDLLRTPEIGPACV
jgi:hypothetical protein